VEEDVLGFEVSVHDFELVEGFIGREDVFGIFEGFGFGDDFILFEFVRETSTVAVFVDKVMRVFSFD
jgi:hypothetical protein